MVALLEPPLKMQQGQRRGYVNLSQATQPCPPEASPHSQAAGLAAKRGRPQEHEAPKIYG